MIQVRLEDILSALAAARNVHEIGFSRVSNAHHLYVEFGDSIRNLATNLDALACLLEQVHVDSTRQPSVAQLYHHYPSPPPQNPIISSKAGRSNESISTASQWGILDGFRETLDSCCHILSDERLFEKTGGYIWTVKWSDLLHSDILRLKSRISVHNIKVSVVFKTLNSDILRERSFQLVDSTSSLHLEAASLRQKFRGKGGSFDGPAPAVFTLPEKLKKPFLEFTGNLFPSISSFTPHQRIDTAVHYFNRIIETEASSVEISSKYISIILEILIATWMVYTIRTDQIYEATVRGAPKTAFEQHLILSGIRIDRFLDTLIEELHISLQQLIGGGLNLLPIPELLHIMGNEIQNKFREDEDTSKMITTTATPEFTHVSSNDRPELMRASLISQDANFTQSMQVLSQTETRASLVLVTTPKGGYGRERETTDNYDLNHVQIIPEYAMRSLTTLSLNPRTITFKTDEYSPFTRSLVFEQDKDMFEFQRAITGYKVNHDDIRVLATSHESRMLGGSRRQDLCRLQLWSSPPPSTTLPSSLQNPGQSKRHTSSSSQYSIYEKAGSSSKSQSSPSVFSKMSRNTFSSSKSVAIERPLLPATAGGTTKNIIHTPPTPPVVVLFAHKAPDLTARIEGSAVSRSFLVVTITPSTTIHEDIHEHSDLHDGTHRCVMLCKPYLQARRSLETSNPEAWELSVLGKYKEGGTEVLKKLKHVILEFDGRDNMTEFMTKFQQVKDIATWRLSKFVQATGG